MDQRVQSLASEVLGLYAPGRAPAVHHRGDRREVASTEIHERTHQNITESSSLGFLVALAGICTTHCRGDEWAETRAHWKTYIGDYFEKSYYVQEGCATTAELLFGRAFSHLGDTGGLVPEDVLAQRPRSYLVAASPFWQSAVVIGERLGQLLRADTMSAVLGLPIKMCEALAIAAMSPPLDMRETTSALFSGESSHWRSLTNAIPTRFQTLIGLDCEAVVSDIIGRVTDHQRFASKPSVRIITETLQRLSSISIRLIDDGDIESAIGALPIGVRQHIRFARSRDVRYGRYLHRVDVAPSGERPEFRLSYAEIMSYKPSPLRVLELMSMSPESTVIIAIHDFDDDGSPVRWLQFGPEELSDKELSAIVETVQALPNSAPRILLSETERQVERLKTYWEDSAFLQMCGHTESEVVSTEVIGDSNSSLLHTFLSSGYSVWSSVVELGTDVEYTPDYRAFGHVVTNGMLATVRWSSLHK